MLYGPILTRQRLCVASRSTELPNGSFSRYTFQKGYDLVLMSVPFVFINSFSEMFLTRKLTLKSILLPLPAAMGSTWNMLASLGLRWWQGRIVRGLHEPCLTVAVIFSRKTIFVPRIQLGPLNPTIPLELCRRPFLIKIAFAVTISKARGQTFKSVAIYAPSPAFCHGELCGIFPYLSIWQRRCCNY